MVVVNLTKPPPVAVLLPPELPVPVVEFPAAPVGTAVAVVVYVEPLLSVVVIRIPPGTRPPIVEVALLPSESFPVATTMEVGEAVLTTVVNVPDLEPEELLPVAAATETAEETTEDAPARASTEM